MSPRRALNAARGSANVVTVTTTGIMPGTHAFVALDLPPGNYALLCFIPEMKDGTPHFAHGMAKRVTVS